MNKIITMNSTNEKIGQLYNDESTIKKSNEKRNQKINNQK